MEQRKVKNSTDFEELFQWPQNGYKVFSSLYIFQIAILRKRFF